MIDISVWLDKRRKTQKGWPIKLVALDRGKRVIISTGLYTQGDLVGGEFQPGEDGYKMKNVTLSRIKNMAYEAVLVLGEKKMTPAGLTRYLSDAIKGKKTHSFLEYAEEYIGHITREGTKRTYMTMYNKVKAYDETVSIEDIDVAWLKNFETSMKKNGYRPNYYGQIERSIRAVFNYCIDREYTTNYPFRRFKTKSEKTIKRNLTLEQLRTLRDYPCEPYQVIYRDLFMLMVYMMGINAVDLFSLPRPSGLKAGTVIQYKRTKVGEKNSGVVKVKIEPEALEIIEKYKGVRHLLNILEDHGRDYKNFLHHMNDGLKLIGPMKRSGRGGKKEREPLFPDLTSYWARHTWATMAAKCKVSVDLIGKALGHAESRVTDIYIEWDNEDIERANRTVIDYINSDKKENTGSPSC